MSQSGPDQPVLGCREQYTQEHLRRLKLFESYNAWTLPKGMHCNRIHDTASCTTCTTCHFCR